MEANNNQIIIESAMKMLAIEIKLNINQKLYLKGLITEEMYTRAKELILSDERCSTYAIN